MLLLLLLLEYARGTRAIVGECGVARDSSSSAGWLAGWRGQQQYITQQQSNARTHALHWRRRRRRH
jgi:hypothetical protein